MCLGLLDFLITMTNESCTLVLKVCALANDQMVPICRGFLEVLIAIARCVLTATPISGRCFWFAIWSVLGIGHLIPTTLLKSLIVLCFKYMRWTLKMLTWTGWPLKYLPTLIDVKTWFCWDIICIAKWESAVKSCFFFKWFWNQPTRSYSLMSEKGTTWNGSMNVNVGLGPSYESFRDSKTRWIGWGSIGNFHAI